MFEEESQTICSCISFIQSPKLYRTPNICQEVSWVVGVQEACHLGGDARNVY